MRGGEVSAVGFVSEVNYNYTDETARRRGCVRYWSLTLPKETLNWDFCQAHCFLNALSADRWRYWDFCGDAVNTLRPLLRFC
jgi:hypothetical protein